MDARVPDSEPMLRLLFEQAGFGLALFAADGRLLMRNPAFLAVNGLAAGDLPQGLPLPRLMRVLFRHGSPARSRSARLARRRWLEHRGGAVALLERQRPDGATIELRRHMTADGLTVIACSDISERKAMQAAKAADQRMLRLLIDATEQGFWFLDPAHRTLDANPAVCRMLGAPREEMLRRPLWDFVPEGELGRVRAELALRVAGQSSRYELTLRRLDGGVVHCLNNASPLFDDAGRLVGTVGLLTDITALKQAEQQLARQSRGLALTLEALDEGVFTTGSDGRVVAWNRRLGELLDLPCELLQRRPTLDEVRAFQIERGDFAHDPRFSDPHWREALALPYRRESKDGRLLEVDERRAEDGSLVRVYRDVTADARAAEALRASEQRFRAMADAAPALIWQCDADGRPLWFNQRWLDYTGRTLAEELALDWTHRLHPDDVPKCRSLFTAALAERRPFSTEFRVPRVDGGCAWIADECMPRLGVTGQFEGFNGYGWDISARRAAEQALAAARDEAERLSRAKSEFLSRMSHELRTPLNAVLGFAQLLGDDPAEPLSPRQRERVQELRRGGEHLLALIDDVLDLARIEAGRVALDLRPVALAPLARECADLVAAAGPAAAPVVLAPDGDAALHVRADPLRLKQVLLNLLSNAVKYGRPGSTVQLSWRREAEGRVRIGVADEGPGLDEAARQRLFVAFERLGAERRGIEGAGIGLVLSKWLVELMHGCIGVDSRPGQGSTFWVVLDEAPEDAPAAAAAAATSPGPPSAPWPFTAPAPTPEPSPPNRPQPSAPSAGAARRTVLYIEDNEVNRLLMQGMLGLRPGIELLLAALPEEGLAVARERQPALVLLDIQLPGMDGFEVLRRLRADAATAAIPVVAVSANAMPADRARAAEAGFAEYVTKPVDLPFLLATIDRWAG